MTPRYKSIRAAAIALMLLSAAAVPSRVAAQTDEPAEVQAPKYVSDQLEITFRSGPGTSYAIRRMVKSGTPLQVVEDDGKGYIRARLADGTTGWVLSRFLTDEPAAREKLAEIEQRMADVRQKSALVEEKLLGLTELEANLERVKTENGELHTELEQLNDVASASEKIAEENTVLKRELENARSEQQLLIEENERLSDASSQNWFLIGAGVIILGMLIGLTIPNIRWKKKRSSMSGINVDF